MTQLCHSRRSPALSLMSELSRMIRSVSRAPGSPTQAGTLGVTCMPEPRAQKTLFRLPGEPSAHFERLPCATPERLGGFYDRTRRTNSPRALPNDLTGSASARDGLTAQGRRTLPDLMCSSDLYRPTYSSPTKDPEAPVS